MTLPRVVLLGLLALTAALLIGWSSTRTVRIQADALAEGFGLDAVQRKLARGLAPAAFVATDADTAQVVEPDVEATAGSATESLVSGDATPFCGLGTVPAGGGPLLPALAYTEATSALQASLEARAGSPDELTRARALWLRSAPTAVPIAFPTAVTTAVPTAMSTVVSTAVPTAVQTAVPTAVPNAESITLPSTMTTAADSLAAGVPARTRVGRSASADRDALLRLAAVTRNPEVYGLAWQACGLDCATLSASGWAQLDSDDAFPWLYVAQEAEARRDALGRDTALMRAARASRITDPAAWLLTTLDQPLWRSLSPAARWLVDQWLITQVAAMPGGPESVVARACGVAGDRGRAATALGGGIESSRVVGGGGGTPAANGRESREGRDAREGRGESTAGATSMPLASNELCNALAESMVARHPNLVGQTLGMSLARRAGWNAERLNALNEERDAISALMAAQHAAKPTYSCTALDAQRAQWIAQGSLGETRMWRAVLHETGVTPSQLALQWRSQRGVQK